MGEAKVTKEDLLKIKEFIEDIRFGSVTVIVQDGRIIQIEKMGRICIIFNEQFCVVKELLWEKQR